MKFSLVMMFAVLLWPTAAHSFFSCGTISCYDNCSNSYTQVIGDTCTSIFDSSQGCYRADGICENEPTSCGSTSCWDYCDNQYKYFSNANQCTSTFDVTRGCYRADAYCSA